MKSGVSSKGPGLAAITKAMAELTSKRVLVGIPAENADRDDGSTITNAQIGYLNEYGRPEQNLPARPHLVPGVTAAEAKIIPEMKKGALAALDGNLPAVDAALATAGMIAVTSVQDLIHAGLKPDLAPRTLEERKRKGGGEEGNNPMVDTGDYLRKIGYTIEGSEDGAP